ncbi:SRPBCC family protein [Sinomonas gamaensis]|uniref:SRPBCC family protein n=1 Tax=Sinomonas gamaensis TaxID=2565624 RepID=UPI001109E7B0|nr:SRPBCC family protein [Sinomonas gamaensis]
MPIVDESIVIPVPPEEVFDYIVEPANVPAFQATVQSCELLTDGPVGVGSHIKGTSKVLGFSFEWTAEVTEHNRPSRWVSKTIAGKLPFTVTYTITAEDNGTRMRYHIESPTGLGGVFGKLADAAVTRSYTHQVRSDLATLSEIPIHQHDQHGRGTATG